MLSIHLLSGVRVVFAHAEEPRLEISVDRILPGGIVDVRGVGFDYEDVVTLTLIGPQGELALGEVTADTEGVFLNIVSLPQDLPEGTYYFRGITTHHYTISPPITVQGSAIPAEGEGEEERWEEEDQLPFPIPTYPPGVVPGGVVPPTAQPTVVTAVSTSNRTIPTLIALTVLGILIVAGVFAMQRRKTQ